MSINYTSLLALIQPVDGTEVGVWGDDVNNGVSSILDVAVAGTQNITTDGNVTLTITQATSSGTNLSSTSAQYAILLLSGSRTATRAITLPASSKTYTVMNSTTGGYAQTVGGLTIAVGEVAKIVYNISTSTWVKASTFSGAGVFSTVTATAATTASSNLGAFNYGTLNFSDTGIVQSSQTSVNSYFQNVIQNTSNGTQASAEFIVYNDQGTATTNYATVGINSSGYSGTGSINAPGYGYFLTASTDLVLGTIGANGIHFTTNSSATDALAISSAGAVSFPGGTANGVAYLNGSKVLTTGSALTFDGTNLSLSSGNIFVPTTSGVFFSSPGTFVNGVYGVGTNNVAFNANGSEQMRLTSTGLGIGYSTMYGKLNVNSMAAPASSGNMNSGLVIGNGSSGTGINIGTYDSGSTATSYGWISAAYVTNAGITNSLVLQPNGGNLGLGVTPSAWSSAFKALQIGTSGVNSILNMSAPAGAMVFNSYYNGTNYLYQNSNYAGRFDFNYSATGGFAWNIASSGTAGGTAAFTQAMTLDNSGNLVLGTTSSLSSQAGRTDLTVNGSSTAIVSLGVGGVRQGYLYTPTTGIILTSETGTLNVQTTTSQPIVFTTNSTERARIDSSGNLLVGTTSSTTAPASGVQLNNGSSIGTVAVGHANGTATGNYYASFAYNSSIIGSITQSGTTAVLYNVTSDQRLKENIVDAPEFGSVIDSIQVRSYDWKADHTHQRAGFIAQELVTVAPEAVHQPADPEEMMAVDYSKLVPMLVKEIQSLRARLKAANIA